MLVRSLNQNVMSILCAFSKNVTLLDFGLYENDNLHGNWTFLPSSTEKRWWILVFSSESWTLSKLFCNCLFSMMVLISSSNCNLQDCSSSLCCCLSSAKLSLSSQLFLRRKYKTSKLWQKWNYGLYQLKNLYIRYVHISLLYVSNDKSDINGKFNLLFSLEADFLSLYSVHLAIIPPKWTKYTCNFKCMYIVQAK